MAGIYSQGGSAGHRYAGWLETVEAKNFTFGGKVFNGSPSAIYVGSNLVWANWLKYATWEAILVAFGQTDGTAVIRATNAYLTQLAASDRDKATALAANFNVWIPLYVPEDKDIMYSLVPTLGYVRSIVTDGSAKFNLSYKYTTDMELEIDATLTTIADLTTFLSNGNWVSNSPLLIIYQRTLRWHIASDGYVDWNGTLSANTRYNIKVGNGWVEVDGVRTTEGADSYSNNANLILFGLSLSTGTSRSYIGKAHSLKVTGNEHDEWWVPFIRNNTNGWLDLKHNTFMAPSVGTITITTTPSTP